MILGARFKAAVDCEILDILQLGNDLIKTLRVGFNTTWTDVGDVKREALTKSAQGWIRLESLDQFSGFADWVDHPPRE